MGEEDGEEVEEEEEDEGVMVVVLEGKGVGELVGIGDVGTGELLRV